MPPAETCRVCKLAKKRRAQLNPPWQQSALNGHAAFAFLHEQTSTEFESLVFCLASRTKIPVWTFEHVDATGMLSSDAVTGEERHLSDEIFLGPLIETTVFVSTNVSSFVVCRRLHGRQ